MNKTVLLVSKEGRQRGAIAEVLSVCGVTVRQFKSSTEAMGAVRGSTYDGLIIGDEVRRLALSGLCSLVRKQRADAQLFVLLNAQSDADRVIKAVGEKSVLVPTGSSPEQIAAMVMDAFDERPPDAWKFEKTRTILKARLWEVSRARRRDSGEEVIFWQLGERFVKDDDLRHEFIESAKKGQTVEHRSLLRVIEVGGENDIPFVVMECPPGDTLHEVRRRMPGAKTWFSPRLSVWIATEILGGLDFVHASSLIHGGIVPQLVWLTRGGGVRVLFSGIENLFSTLERGMRPGMTSFPTSYLAGEQLREQIQDARSDLFVVGIFLHELLTQRPLFQRDRPGATRDAILTHDVPDLEEDLPQSLIDLTMESLERDPNFRPDSAKTLRAGLLQILRQKMGGEDVSLMQKELAHLIQNVASRPLSGPQKPL